MLARMEPVEDPTTAPQDELTRIVRTAVQAAVAALCTWLLNHYGLHLDPSVVVKFVYPAVLVVQTALVHQLSKLPAIGKYVALLNGPRRAVAYVKPAALQK